MKAMVFAAGLGTRLKPITDTLPKALVPVGGEPLLAHVIRKLTASGFDEIIVNVHHFAPLIRAYLETHDFGVPVRISDETDLLRETGGAVRHARPLLQGKEPFLIHNVDILSDLDLNWFCSAARPDALANILVSKRETARYFLFDDSMRLVGWTNVKTGEVRSPYPDLDLQACRKFAFAGIHLHSQDIFQAFDEYGFGERFSIVDFYLRACADHPVYGIVPEELTLIDVGKLDTLAEAERLYSSM